MPSRTKSRDAAGSRHGKAPTGRPSISLETYEALDRLTEQHGYELSDVTELAILAKIGQDLGLLDPAGAEVADRCLADYLAGTAITPHTWQQDPDAPWASVVVLRMSHRRPAAGSDTGPDPGSSTASAEHSADGRADDSAGYPRDHVGMGLAESADAVWEGSRGYWRAAGGIEYLAPSRLGHIPYVFKTDRWARHSSGRIWATHGRLINPATGMLQPLKGTPGLEEPASSTDLAVAQRLAGTTFAWPRGAANPVLRLSRREAK